MSSSSQQTFAQTGYPSDEKLVRGCLLGSQEAWSQLIDKYKKLIYSIPLKYGLTSDDASEILQAVSFTILADLEQLRNPEALPAWLIRLTAHKCARWKRDRQHLVPIDFEAEKVVENSDLPEDLLARVEREQIFRDTLGKTTPECKRLVELLFFEDPPLSYEAAAQSLGIAKGSVGATRMRCLERLRRLLDQRGFH